MSREIDERIVEMRFENQQFEKGVETTLSSLDKLRKGLKFDEAVSGLDSVQKTINNLDFSRLISNSTFAIERFLQIHRHLDQVIQKIERTVKSLSIDQVTAGWTKYAQKTEAVQTIMAATSKDFSDTGKQMEYVNEQLEKLNWFSDETSYSFTDMTNNVGKFTANGVKLEDAVTAMEGISTWAAISGGKVSEAARAMYNLSQAMGTGAVKLIDWKSIENANMATREFKENVIEVALRLGTLKKEADGIIHTAEDAKHIVSTTNFNEWLKDEWFNKDVLTEVLKLYGGFTDRLNQYINEISDAGTELTASDMLEYIEEFSKGTLDMNEAMDETGLSAERLREMLADLNSAEFDLGKRAFVAAQEAKTFGEAIDATKDAVSTGWMTTFETIFGNYEQARKLWTRVANELYDVFAEGGNTRNKILKKWAKMTATYGEEELTGRELFLKSFGNIWDSAKEVISTIVDARNSVLFPGLKTDGEIIKYVADQLFSFSKSFYEATSKFKLSQETLDRIGEIFRSLFQTVKNVASPVFNIIKQVVSGIGAIASALAPYLLRGVELVSHGLEVLSGVLSRLANTAIGKAASWIADKFEKIGIIIGNFIDHISSIELPGWLQDIVDWFESIWGWLEAFGLAESPTEEIAEQIDSDASSIQKSGKRMGKSMAELALEIIRGDYGNDPERKAAIEALGYDYETAQHKIVNAIFTPYGEFVEGWEEILAEWYNVPAELNPPTEDIFSTEEAIKQPRTFVQIVKEAKEKLLSWLPAAFTTVKEYVGIASEKIKEFGSYLNEKLGIGIEKVISFWPKVKDFFINLGSAIGDFFGRLKDIGGLQLGGSGFFGTIKKVFDYLTGKKVEDVIKGDAVETVADRFFKLIEKIKNAGKALVDFFKRLKNIGSIKFQDTGFFGTIKQIFDYLIGKKRLLPDSIDDILNVNKIGEIGPKLVTLSDKFTKLKITLSNVAKSVWSWIQDTWPKVKQVGKDIWDWFKNFGSSAKSVIGQVAPVVGDSFTLFVESLKTTFGGMSELSPAEIVKKIPEVFTAVKDFFANIGTGILTEVDGAAEAFEKVRTFITDVISKVKEFFAWLSGQLQNLLGSDAVPEIPGLDFAIRLASALPNGLNNIFGVIYNEFGSGVFTNGSPADKSLDILAGFINPSKVSNFGATLDFLATTAENGMNNVGSAFGLFGETLSEDSETAKKGVTDILDVMSFLASNTGSREQLAFATMLLGGTKGISRRIGRDASQVSNAFSGDLSQFQDILYGVLDDEQSLTDDVTQNVNEKEGVTLGEAFSRFTNGVKTGLSDGVESLTDAESNAIDMAKMFGAIHAVARTITTYAAIWNTTKLVGGIGGFLKNSGKLIDDYRKFKYGSNIKKITKAIVRLALGFAIIALAIIALGKYKDYVIDGQDVAAGICAGVLIIYSLLSGISTYFPAADPAKDLFKIGLGFLAAAASLIVFGVAIKLFNGISWNQMIDGLGKIVLVLLALAGFSWIVGQGGGDSLGKTLMGAAVAVLILVAAVYLFGTMDMSVMTQGVLAVGILLFALGLLSKFVGNGVDTKSFIGILAVAIAVGFLVAAVWVLGTMPLDQLAKGIAAVVALIWSLSKTFQAAGAGLKLGSVLAMIVFVGLISLLLVLLDALDLPAGTFLILRSVGKLFKELAKTIQIMSKIEGGPVGSFLSGIEIGTFFAGIIAAFTALGAVFAGFDWLLSNIPGLGPTAATDAVTSMIEKLIPIFEAIGKVFGAGLLKGLLGGLVNIDFSTYNMDSFVTGMKEFFGKLAEIDDENVSKGIDVLTKIGAAFANAPKNIHVSLLSNGLFGSLLEFDYTTSWESLTKGLEQLAKDIKSFTEICNTINVDEFERALGIVERLNETKKLMTDKNILEELLNWTSTWSEFVGDFKNPAYLLPAIKGMMSFGGINLGGGLKGAFKGFVSGIGATITTSVGAASSVGLENLDRWLNEKTMNPLERLGLTLDTFAKSINGFPPKLADDLEKAIKMLNDLNGVKQNLENMNIVEELFSWTDSWSEFMGVRKDPVSRVTNAIKGIKDALFGGGIKHLVTGKNGFLSTITTGLDSFISIGLDFAERKADESTMNPLERLGKTLSTFSNSIISFNLFTLPKVKIAIEIIKSLNELYSGDNKLPDMDWYMELWKWTDSLSEFMGYRNGSRSITSLFKGVIDSFTGKFNFSKNIGSSFLVGLDSAIDIGLDWGERKLEEHSQNPLERLGQTLATFVNYISDFKQTTKTQVGLAVDIIEELNKLYGKNSNFSLPDMSWFTELVKWTDSLSEFMGYRKSTSRGIASAISNIGSAVLSVIPGTRVAGSALRGLAGATDIGLDFLERLADANTLNPLERLGLALKNFCNYIVDFNANTTSSVQTAVSVVQELNKLYSGENALPNLDFIDEIVKWTSSWDEFLGYHFGNEYTEGETSPLERFGMALASFSKSVTGEDGNSLINTAAIDNAIKASKNLAGLKSSDLPDKSVFEEAFGGMNAWTEFSTGLGTFGSNLWLFYNYAKGIDPDQAAGMMALIDALTTLHQALATYHEMTGDSASAGTEIGSLKDNIGGLLALIQDYEAEAQKLLDLNTAISGIYEMFVTPLDISDDNQNLKGFKESLTQFAGAGLEEFKKWFTSEEATEYYKAAITRFCGKFSYLLNTTMEEDKVTGAYDDGFKTFAHHGVTIMTKWYSDTASDEPFKSAVGAFCNGIAPYLTPDSDKANLGIFLTAMESAALGGVSAFNQAFMSQNALRQYFNTVDSFGRTMSVKLHNTGFNTMLGLAQGLRDGRVPVVNTARAIADNIVATINQALKINSPSKLTMQSGESVDEGLVLGLMNRVRSVRDASGAVAYSMVDTMTNILDNAGAMLTDDSYPTITPVLDMSNIAYGAGQINSMFSAPYLIARASYEQAAQLNAANAWAREESRLENQNGLYRDVVSAIADVKREVAGLSDTINNMQIVMDSGALVGQIAGPMDNALGRRYMHQTRRN